MKNYDIRTLIDERKEKIGRKIRDAEVKRTPYMIIVGEKEQKEQKISIRKRNVGDMGVFEVDKFINAVGPDLAGKMIKFAVDNNHVD